MNDENLFAASRWIWAEDNARPCDFVIFRKVVELDKPPKTAICRIAAETRYFFYINGKPVIMDGGLFRESEKDCGYYDETDVAKFLSKGANAFTFVCRFYGNDGRNMLSAGAAGFIFECDELRLYSDSNFRVYRNPAYVPLNEPPASSGLFGGHDLLYNATVEGKLENYQMPEYASELFVKSSDYGEYPCAPWNRLVPRPIPLYSFSQPMRVKKYSKLPSQVVGGRLMDLYTVQLPTAMWFYPQFEVFANGGDRIEIKSDRYASSGSPDDCASVYRGRRLVYTCSNEVQSFEFPEPLFGTAITFAVTPTVKVVSLGYRETSFPSERTFLFESGDNLLDAFADKACLTLKSCMRDNLMDSPERERAVWLSDASAEARALLYAFDTGAVELVKKTLNDVLTHGADVFLSRVPGNCPVEIPSASLTAISEFGILAEYYRHTADVSMLAAFLPKIMAYLRLWDLQSDGFVLARDGNLRLCDYHYNADEKLIINALYYSALKFAETVSEAIGDERYDTFLKGRKESIEKAFALCYDGTAYGSSGFYDDRANALAVLSGLASADRYEGITDVLSSVYCASEYFEGYVLDALGKMGKTGEMIKRLKSRYRDQILSENPTLPEDFSGRGNLCHGSSAAPIYCLCAYVFGLKTLAPDNISITPDLTVVSELECEVTLKNGRIAGFFRKNAGRTEIIIDNRADAEVLLCLDNAKLGVSSEGEQVKRIRLNRGKNKFTL